jgi:DNA-binding NarL/FixJ family response regulator
MAKLTKEEISRHASQAHICHTCHGKFTSEKQVRTHKCGKADKKIARELERSTGHVGMQRSWRAW